MFGSVRNPTALLAVLMVVGGCMSPNGDTTQGKRNAVHQMRSETLAELYKMYGRSERPGDSINMRRSVASARPPSPAGHKKTPTLKRAELARS